MEILSKLFGSEARVKILRLFIFNPEEFFDIDLVSGKSKIEKKNVKKEFAILEKIHFLKKGIFYKVAKKKKGRKIVEVKIKSHGYCLNENFPYITALKQLLINTKTLDAGEIVKRLSKSGKLKLIIIAGVFTQNKDSRLDLLVVGDNIKKQVLTNIIKSIEAELGTELLYAYFETADFNYRIRMFDKLVKDVLDYPHQVLLDKLF